MKIENIKNIIVAEIVTIQKHENADRLNILFLNVAESKHNEHLQKIIGEDGLIQVITAAPNISVGILVPYLAPGFAVPGFMDKDGKTIVLESREMRGVVSHGMILGEVEIGIGTDNEGISIINKENPKYEFSDTLSIVGKSLFDILSPEVKLELEQDGKLDPQTQEKFDLITKDLLELVGVEDLKNKLKNNQEISVYWGTAPTGKVHTGYFVSMFKIADFLQAGLRVKILLADMHAYLDNMKSTWDILEFRLEYYEKVLKEMLKIIGVPLEKLEFVRGTSFQLSQKYTLDMYKAATKTSLRDAKKSGSEVVKQVESPILGSMLYPILQALDEEYLEADAQLGGVDQRKIFMFARTLLPDIGYKKRIHFLTPLIPGLGKSGKMSSSEPLSKIDFDDSAELIKEKITKAYSVDGVVEGNSILAMLKYVFFRLLETHKRPFEVVREEKWGGNVAYAKYEDLEQDFVAGKLSSVDLKPAFAEIVIEFLQPLREFMEQNSELVSKAYSK